jgi:hypothetical protein
VLSRVEVCVNIGVQFDFAIEDTCGFKVIIKAPQRELFSFLKT